MKKVVVLVFWSLLRVSFSATSLCWADGDTLLPGVQIFGRVFADFYLPSSQILKGDFQQVSTSFWLGASPQVTENSSAHFLLTGDEIAASVIAGKAQFKTALREGYLTYAKSGWELRAGKMIIPWGKSDGINPTDFLTAKDFTFFNPDDEVRRIGATSIWISWTPEQGNSPLTLTGVITPLFPQSQPLLPPNQIPSTFTLASSPQTPSSTLSNSETALKISYAGNQWDASWIAYRGWNHLPDLQVTGISGTPSVPSLSAAWTFHRQTALGMDASTTFGKWILRGEGAYVWTENDNGQNPLIQPSFLNSVVGVERPLGTDFRIQGQLGVKYFPNYSTGSSLIGTNPVAAALNQQVAQANALIQNYQDRTRLMSTFRFSYSNEVNGIDADLFLLVNFVGGDYLFRPQVTYSWTDSLKTTGGLAYYAGPLDRPLGALAPFSAVYTEFKYLF